MKHEWKKHEKALYLPAAKPVLSEVPRFKFFAIKGEGDPNGQDFAERVGVLYSLAYAVRMMPKHGHTPEGYFEYTVYPLEGVWGGDGTDDKSKYIYTIMIRQPDFVTQEIAAMALDYVKRKKPHEFLDDAYFCEMEDGLALQIMHIGDYDDEPKSFALMQKFMGENGLIRAVPTHREIYLSDPRKLERDKLKTVLRYCVSGAK